jgi:hypothetical protein
MIKEPKHFDLIMIVTHQDNNNISNFMYSVSDNSYINLFVIVVSQVEFMLGVNVSELTKFNQIFLEKKSLSAARNHALNYLNDNDISASYIMFPDDDSTFDNIFFENFPCIQLSCFNYITPIYNTHTNDLYLGKTMAKGTSVKISDYNMIGSPNQLIQYERFKEHIYFNEELGVGAKYGSSEDLDLFIRLTLAGAKFIYTDKLYSYHPKKTDIYKNKKIKDILIRFNNYSCGFAFLIFRYRLYIFIPNYLFRTFAAFIVFAIRLNFKLSLAYFIQFFARIKFLLTFFLIKK